MSSSESYSSSEEDIGYYPCTFTDCNKAFSTRRRLNNHKRNDESHDYCDKCDLDFTDWDQYVAHKAASEKHRSCGFCGMDFNTISGLEKHLNSFHPASQNIKCIACDKVFQRASAYMYHLELEPCENTRGKLEGHILHKRLISVILSNADAMEHVTGSNWRTAAVDYDEGGVTLGAEPLTGLHEGDLDAIVERLGDVVVDGPITSRATPSTSVKSTKASSRFADADEDDTAIVETVMAGPSTVAPQLFSSQRTSTAPVPRATSNTVSTLPGHGGGRVERLAVKPLFQGKAPAAQMHETDWEARLVAKREVDEEMDGKKNMFKTRFWDPRDKNYDPEFFFNPMLEVYTCPFPQCSGRMARTPIELDAHILTGHRHRSVRCPSCQDLFPATYRLVAHWEAPRRARCGEITDSEWFSGQVEELTGGFLTAHGAYRQDCGAAAYIRWVATTPADWVDGPLVEVKRTYDRGGRTVGVVEKKPKEEAGE